MNDISINKSEAVVNYLDFLDRSRRTNGKTRYQIHEKLMSKDIGIMYGVTESEFIQLEEMLKEDTSVYPTPKEIENGAEDTYTLEKKNFTREQLYGDNTKAFGVICNC